MDADFVHSRLQQASEFLDHGRAKDALACLDEVEPHVFESDDRVEFVALRAWALSQLNDDERALEALAPLIEEYPDNARLHATRGIVLSNANRLSEARESLETAASLDDGDGIAMANLGYVYEKMREFEHAVRAYDHAIDRGADVAWVLQRKAAAQREIGDFRSAKVTLGRYLSLAPEDDFEWTSLAIVHSELGEFDAAFNCYERAEAINPESTSLRFNWGLTAERAGRIDVAMSQLGRLMQTSPDTVQTNILRAYVLEHEGKLTAAWAAHQRAVEVAPLNDHAETAYAIERAMDFCSEHGMRGEADLLIGRAFVRNVCTVQVCESYRELSGEPMEKGYWFSLVAETQPRHAAGGNGAVSRGALSRADRQRARRERAHAALPEDATAADLESLAAAPTTRSFQIIARDRDDALAVLDRFVRKVGHRVSMICEFIDEEPYEDDCTGIFEVEPVIEPPSDADPDSPPA